MAEKKDLKTTPSSYFPIEIFFYIVFIFWGINFVTDWSNKNHNFLVSFYKNFLFNFINFFAKYVVFAFFLSLFLFIIVIIYSIKEKKIRNKIMNKVLPPEGAIQINLEKSIIENPKWKLVEEHINSEDANKWKLAILEADIILSELLDSLNLLGDSVGEKLKNIEKSDFNHIEEAWEAHKIRNAIAHQGSDFLLTRRESKRIINLYKIIFEEFKII
ncbi:MAG: hypothetical protein V1910_03215 [bacterium]